MNRSQSREPAPVVLTIVGPTAVGKTSVAILVAKMLGCEIVSADSRQVYRGMDIGTAKPTPSELSVARHHLIDVAEPSEAYDAARFALDAERAISDVRSRGFGAIVAGGTGFYIASLFEGLFEGPGRDEELRASLNRRAADEGTAALHSELLSVDPQSAARIHRNDRSRVVRALEVYLMTGKTLTEWHEEDTRAPTCRPLYVGLTVDRGVLYSNIDSRVERMFETGLLDEVRRLVGSGRLSSSMPAASAVGYSELLPIVEGREATTLDSTIDLIKRNTRRYAKRQLTWFCSLSGVTWINVDQSEPQRAADEIVALLKGDRPLP